MTEVITVKAVVVYAAGLRAQGDREIVQDCYAAPYRPTEAMARKLSQQLGPAPAINYLRNRAAMHARENREQAKASEESMKVHGQRVANFRAKRDRDREKLRPGQRIDDAIARLSTVASPSSSVLDADRVSGGERNQVPAFAVDAAAKARAIALKAAREIEAYEDSMKTRDVQEAK